MERACGFINRNYKWAVSVDDIARSAALNKNYRIRLFKSELAATPGKYLVETRLFHARLLLIESQLSVKNIALSCRFNTPYYFIKCFREKFGDTPERYRELERDL